MIGIYVLGVAGMPELNQRGWIASHADTPDGRGETVLTEERTRAKTFANAGEAFEFWRQQSKTVPLRPDGRPNRPLTAYTVEILPINHDPGS